MPIYAYRCATCGHAQDVLQKMSDPVLTVCPACSAATYAKQLTAAGFQLKGSGWYVTDFRGGNTAAAPKPEGDSADAKSADKAADAAPAKTDAKAADKAADRSAPAAPAAAPAPAPAAPAPTPSSGS
jgi:putative FmdB family regulatory protein